MMKKSILIALLALFLMSCGSNNERLLTSATGSIYECLVVSSPAVKEPVCSTMAGDMYGLPQMEAYFTVSHVSPAQFDDFLKSTRNILIIDIDEHKYTQVKTTHSRNSWSKPQALVRIQAPSNEIFEEYWSTHGEVIRDWFVREELARQIRFYRANTNKGAREILNKQGYDLLIPEDYMLIMDTTLCLNDQMVNVLWCCNNKGPMRKDVIVYSYPYTSQEQFSNEAIIQMRDNIMGKLVSAQVAGSHMGTEFKHFPPVSRYVPALRDSIGGFYAVETRGLWKIYDGEAMGGPFVSLTRLDQVNGRVVTAEGFLFAAGQKKRNAMRQIEAILYTLKMPNEK
ncbi:MAG: DUF4837 family protein [Paludibacteraceae bacterium]|nr:DUF4837 family protein [Paludibacteraceae bacterium]